MMGTTLTSKANLEETFESVRKAGSQDNVAVYLARHGVAIQGTCAYGTDDARGLNLSDPAMSVMNEEFG